MQILYYFNIQFPEVCVLRVQGAILYPPTTLKSFFVIFGPRVDGTNRLWRRGLYAATAEETNR